LYPNTMITLNTSPETKIGKIIEMDTKKISIRNVDGVVVDFNLKEFGDFLRKEKLSISKSKVLFSQKKKGVLSDMVDKFFKKRIACKHESKKLQKELLKIEEKIKMYEKTHPNL
jgi:DNA polymerase elongation subunit (family B)